MPLMVYSTYMQPQQNQNYWEQPDATAPVPPVAVETQPEPSPADATPQSLTWQASEYVHHEKSTEWFLVLIGVGLALLLLDLFLIRSWTFGVLIVVMTVTAGLVARRPPRVITYTLTPEGIRIDDKQFAYSEFRLFGVVQEGAFYSIRLIPTKRFMPMVAVYFPQELGEQLVDLLGSMLPMDHIKLDPIDRFVEKIRF